MLCGWLGPPNDWIRPCPKGCMFVSEEAAGPLKAKMVSYKLQFAPSVSFLPLRDHTAFQIGPELTSHTGREKWEDRGDRDVSAWDGDMTVPSAWCSNDAKRSLLQKSSSNCKIKRLPARIHLQLAVTDIYSHWQSCLTHDSVSSVCVRAHHPHT